MYCDKDSLIKDISFYMRKVHEAVDAFGNSQLKELDLTRTQMDMLFYLLIRKDETISQKSIEQDFDLKHTSVIGLLQRMEKKKLLKTIINPDDRRSRNVVLLDKALEIESEIEKTKNIIYDTIRSKVPDEKIEQLKSLLRELYEALLKGT